MRKNIVAGNWKMNLNYPDSTRLIDDINTNEIHPDAELIVAPPSIYLSSLNKKQHHFREMAARDPQTKFLTKF